MLDGYADIFSSNIEKRNITASARALAANRMLTEMLHDYIENALDQGKPIPCKQVENYFDYINLIANREAAEKLALRLAASEAPLSDEDYAKDHTYEAILFKALLALGYDDHAKKLLTQTFGKHFDPEKTTVYTNWNILRPVIGSAWPVKVTLLKIASWELPGSSTADQLLFLRGHLKHPERKERVSAIIKLTERHLTELSEEELTALVSCGYQMLGSPVKPGNLSQLSGQQALAALAQSLDDNTGLPASPGKQFIHKILTPEIGKLSNPTSEEFAVLDGIDHARELWKQGDEPTALNQLRDTTIRIILDDGFRTDSTKVSVQDSNMIHSRSSRADELLMQGFLTMNLPRELYAPAVKTIALLCPKQNGTYLTKDLYQTTAQAFAKLGDYKNACRIYHRFCAVDLDTDFRREDIRNTAYLIELEIRRALASGHTSEAVEIYIRHHRLLPYEKALAADVLKALRDADDLLSAEKMDRTITGFWEEKIKGLPDVKTYRDALALWKTSYAAPED